MSAAAALYYWQATSSSAAAAPINNPSHAVAVAVISSTNTTAAMADSTTISPTITVFGSAAPTHNNNSATAITTTINSKKRLNSNNNNNSSNMKYQQPQQQYQYQQTQQIQHHQTPQSNNSKHNNWENTAVGNHQHYQYLPHNMGHSYLADGPGGERGYSTNGIAVAKDPIYQKTKSFKKYDQNPSESQYYDSHGVGAGVVYQGPYFISGNPLIADYNADDDIAVGPPNTDADYAKNGNCNGYGNDDDDINNIGSDDVHATNIEEMLRVDHEIARSHQLLRNCRW